MTEMKRNCHDGQAEGKPTSLPCDLHSSPNLAQRAKPVAPAPCLRHQLLGRRFGVFIRLGRDVPHQPVSGCLGAAGAARSPGGGVVRRAGMHLISITRQAAVVSSRNSWPHHRLNRILRLLHPDLLHPDLLHRHARLRTRLMRWVERPGRDLIHLAARPASL